MGNRTVEREVMVNDTPMKIRVTSVLGEAESEPKPGEKEGRIPFAYHLLPMQGLASVAKVMKAGEEKGRSRDWEDLSVETHINHAMSHLVAYLGGMDGEDHLAHAGCRVLMAIERAIMDRMRVYP